MYRVGVKASILHIRTESDRRVEREKIDPHDIIEARLVILPYGAVDIRRTVEIEEKPR